MQGQLCPDDIGFTSKVYKTQEKRQRRATSDSIPSPTDIKLFELNDNPYYRVG
jgi:hypothetical protein